MTKALSIALMTLALPFGNAAAVELDYVDPPLDNPLKGLVPYANKSADKLFPHSLEFDYIPLSAVLDRDANGDYEFDWSPVETFLENAKGRGHQGVFRIYSEYPGQGVSIPQFLVDDGVTVTELTYGNQTAWTPDYTNADLIDALTATVAALGLAYDDDERIGFLELGLLGVWGEWHNFENGSFEASTAVRGQILQAYESAFSATKLLTRYPRGVADGARANVNARVGYHDDSFTFSTLGTEPWKFMELMTQAGALDKWQTEAVGGELFPNYNACVFEDVCVDDDGNVATDFIETVESAHTTYMRVGEVFTKVVSETRRERAEAAVRRMGYDLHIDEATITPGPGNDFSVSATLVNFGVAPFYQNWPVILGLLDSNGATIQEWATGWRVDGLIAGDERVFGDTFTPTAPVPAGAQIALRVPNPMAGGLPLRFSNFSQQPDGQAWMVLGGADGAAPPAAPPKALFIRAGLGTVGFVEGGSDEQAADVFNFTDDGGNHSWGELGSALVAEGFDVLQKTEDPVVGGVPTPVPFDEMILKKYAVIVFGSNNADYTTAQVDAVTDYIEGGGSAVFMSDANFGQDWGDAPSSDTQFLSRFGLSMNQDNGGTYDVRRTDEFLDPTHPILNGVDFFFGEGVSPITRGTPPAGVTSAVVTKARFGVTPNTGPTQGTSAPATAADGSLVVASLGTGRIAGHFDRNTFFNENGAGTDLNKFDNEAYARNLFNWLVGRPTATSNFAPRGHFPDLIPASSVTEGVGFPVTVVAKDPDGNVASVALKVDGVLIATDTAAPYQFTAPGLALGDPVLTATITDNLGATTEVHLPLTVTELEQPLDRTGWVLSSSINNNPSELAKAIDGDLSPDSRWVTGTAQAPGQTFSIDFGQREMFQRIVLEAPSHASDYPRGYLVRGSDDGINYTEIATGTGVGVPTEIAFAAPVTYRHIEIEQTGSLPPGTNWWSIQEINVLQPPADAALPLSSWLQFYHGATPPSLLDDSDHDGLTLLEEYAFNTDPGAPSEAPTAGTGIDAVDQKRYVDLSFRRWKASAVNDVDYLIQSSSDLVAWGSAGIVVQFPTSPISNGDGTETVTARIKFDGSIARNFVRLELSGG